MGRARHIAVLLAMCNAGKTEDPKECDQFADILRRSGWKREYLNWSLNKRGELIWIWLRRTRIIPGRGQWTSLFLWKVTISLSSGATVSVTGRTILYRVISIYRVACEHASASISVQFSSVQFSTNLNHFELSVSWRNYTLKATFLVVEFNICGSVHHAL